MSLRDLPARFGPALRRWFRRLDSLDAAGALCLVVVGLVAAAWIRGMSKRYFDYDELEHTYAAWLIRKGLRPFDDFFENHPPFFWYPLSIAFRIFGDSYAILFANRALTAVGNLLFLAGVAKNLALSFARLPTSKGLRTYRATPRSLPPLRFAVAAALIISEPIVVECLEDFRSDIWSNVVLIFAIYWYRRAPQRTFRSAAIFAFLGAGAILCSPKLLLFTALFAGASVVIESKRLTACAGMLAGGLAAVGLAVLFAVACRLDLRQAYRMSYVYHFILNRDGGFGHGLYNAVFAHRVPLGVLCLSTLGWLAVARRQVIRSPFELAVLGFLALQLALVSFPYKQYYGPWFLLGIAFIPYLDLGLRRVKPLHSMLVAIVLLYAATNALSVFRSFPDDGDAAKDIASRKWIEERVSKDGIVMAAMNARPLFRRSALYHHTTSSAPSGHDSERIMDDLGLGRRSTPEFYLQELEQSRPELILLDGWYTDRQRAALHSYLDKHATAYEALTTPVGPAMMRRKP